MIRIKGIKHEEVEVSVNQSTIIDAAIRIVQVEAKIAAGDRLDPITNMITREDSGYRHGIARDVICGPATEEQRQAFAVIAYLEKLRYPKVPDHQ